MSWLLSAGRLLRGSYFPNRTAGVVSVVNFILSVVSATGLLTGILKLEATLGLASEQQFLTYIWTTFWFSVSFVAISAVLLQRLLRSNQEAARAAECRDRAMVMQHRMAEAVRSSARKNEAYDISHGLQLALGSLLPEYLKARLGDRKFHCTVKRISAAQNGGYKLTDVFRDPGQSTTTRPYGEELAENNYLYHRFKQPNSSDAKQIYLHDVLGAESGAFNELRERARKRGYRSVLAIPLNQPTEMEGVDRLMGFLGIDSPPINAFDELFDVTRKNDRENQGAGVDSPYNPLEELNLIYGLADAVATILILSQSTPARAGTHGS